MAVYEAAGAVQPGELRAHSNREVTVSWAARRGATLDDICRATSWASGVTFVRFYSLDTTRASVACSVLSVVCS